MAPGTMPAAHSVTITGTRTGAASVAELTSGGFDPVAIPAASEDTLTVTTVLFSGRMHHARSVVPARRRPRVVRTSPARARTDVAINTSIIIVFSEPIAPRSRDTEHIVLRAGAEVLQGEIRPVAGSEVAVEWVPAQPLAPGTNFELVLSQSITDLSGDPIEGELTVPFRTVEPAASAPPPLSPPPAPVTQVIAFSRNGDIYVMHADGTGIRQVTSGPGDDLGPVWSPDGTRIAFSRHLPDLKFATEAAIYLINPDGSGLVRLSAPTGARDRSPTWSPDGTRIAFATAAPVSAIYIMNADGTGRTRMTDPLLWSYNPAWSPDGSRLAYNLWNPGFSRPMLYVQPAAGGFAAAVRLTDDYGAVYSASWSADGSRLLTTVSKCVGGPSCPIVEGPYLTSADPDGSNIVRLSDMIMLPEIWGPEPVWSPNGGTVLFTQAACDVEMMVWPCDEPPGILALRLSDGRVTRIADGSDPDWR
jgi:hypothetical protein